MHSMQTAECVASMLLYYRAASAVRPNLIPPHFWTLFPKNRENQTMKNGTTTLK